MLQSCVRLCVGRNKKRKQDFTVKCNTAFLRITKTFASHISYLFDEIFCRTAREKKEDNKFHTVTTTNCTRAANSKCTNFRDGYCLARSVLYTPASEPCVTVFSVASWRAVAILAYFLYLNSHTGNVCDYTARVNTHTLVCMLCALNHIFRTLSANNALCNVSSIGMALVSIHTGSLMILRIFHTNYSIGKSIGGFGCAVVT